MHRTAKPACSFSKPRLNGSRRKNNVLPVATHAAVPSFLEVPARFVIRSRTTVRTLPRRWENERNGKWNCSNCDGRRSLLANPAFF